MDSGKPLSIVFDALAARFGGTAYAVGQLAAAVRSHPRVGAVLVVTRKDSIVDHAVRSLAEIGLLRLRPERALELLERLAWEALTLRSVVRERRAGGLVSFSGMLPLHPGCPVISLQANPVPFEDTRGVGAFVRRAAMARTAGWARATYVPTRHVAELLSGFPRVRVVPLGVDRERFHPGPKPGAELLCVSDFYPHKRHDLLLDAYDRLTEHRPRLRMIGNPAVDPDWFDRVRSRAAEIPGAIVEGPVSFESLLAGYQNARAFVLASERESFSMSLAEALCCGVPAIARDHPTLRETGGDGALYVAGDDPEAWTEAMRSLIDDQRRWESLREAAVRESRRFSWQTMAQNLVDDLHTGA